MSAATDGSRPMVSVIGCAITLGMMVGGGVGLAVGLTVGHEMLGYGEISQMKVTLAEIHKAVEEMMKGGAR